MGWRGRLLAALAAVALLLGAAGAAGSFKAGIPDGSFGRGGVVLRDFGSQPYWGGVQRLIATPDGGALVLSETSSLARFLPDGGLDTGFGEGGFVTADVWGALAMAVAPGGKIVTVGDHRTRRGEGDLYEVRRYLPGGRPDPTFGKHGSVVIPAPRLEPGQGEGVVVEPNGRVIVLTRLSDDERSAIGAIRLTPRGKIDRSYGKRGYAVAWTPGTEYAEFINDLILPRVYALDDGKLTIGLSGEGRDLLMRLDSSGRLDRGFGSGGKVLFEQPADAISALAFDREGRLVVSFEHEAVARFLSDGSFDPSFGAGGVAVLPEQQRRLDLRAVEVAADGKILLGGYAEQLHNVGPERFLVARLEPNGALDSSFGDGAGFVQTLPAPESIGEGVDLALVGEGGVLLGGIVTPAKGSNASSRIGLLRYRADGSLSPGFGDDGIAIVRPRAQASDEAEDLLPVDRGRTIVVGRGGGQVVVARYTRAGHLDPSFGRRGLAAPVAVSGDYFGEHATSVAPYPGGRFVVGTFSRSVGGLLRYLPDGRLDRSFGRDGVVRIEPIDGVLDVVATPDGKLLAVGTSFRNCVLVLARFHANGSLDRSFAGGRGSLVVAHGYGPCGRFPATIALERDGEILVGGAWEDGFLAKLSPQGKRNRNFGRRGKRGVAVALPTRPQTIALDSRGRILVGGNHDKKFAVVRLTPRGFPDPSFGQAGTASFKSGHLSEASAL